MTKAELIKALEKYEDDDEIGVFWDDCQWPIHRLFDPVEEIDWEDNRKFKALIDCR